MKNIPEIPTVDCKKLIADIDKKICRLDNGEREEIKEICNYHGCECSVIAEKVSELLGVSYSCIFDLL